MIFPFVPRSTYDEVCRSRDCERENAQILRREVADLTAQLLQALRPATVIAPAAITPLSREISAVTLAIREQAGDNPRLAQHYRQLAARLRKEGRSDEEIVAAIGSWVTTEPTNPAEVAA